MSFFSNLVGEEGPRIPGVKDSSVCYLKILSAFLTFFKFLLYLSYIWNHTDSLEYYSLDRPAPRKPRLLRRGLGELYEIEKILRPCLDPKSTISGWTHLDITCVIIREI